MRSESWSIPGADGEVILGNTHRPTPDIEPIGVVLLCHGFKGYKDYGFFPRAAQAFADAGLIAHRFNFSHSGMTNQIETFERPDLFEKDTWSKQVLDVVTLAGAIMSGELPGAGLPLVLFGHSRGGVTSLLSAVELGETADAVITAAAPHQACSLDEDDCRRLRKTGRLVSPSGRTGQDLFVGREWLDEIERDPDRFDPVRAAESIRCPLLIIHGKGDVTVPWIAAHALHDAPGEHRDLLLIDDASHTFNAPNPMAEDTDTPRQTAQMIDAAVGFAARSCTSQSSDR